MKQQKNVITITENAARYIKSLHPSNDGGLRVSIKKGGCSGSEYDFQYTQIKQPGDEVVETHGVKIYIDPAALLHILGSVMDFEETIFESKLFFINPNEQSRCGCGKSVQFTSIHPKGEHNAN